MATQRDQLIWTNVEKLLEEKGWNYTNLAEAMKVKPQSVNSIKSGLRGIGSRTLKKLSQALDVDEIHLLSIDAPSLHPRPIPVISWVHAGAFAECDDRWPSEVSGVEDPVYSYVKTSPNSFGLRVDGDSMLPRFMPGDIAIVDTSLQCDNGAPCVVSVNGEVSLKLFWDKETEILLKSMNDKYPEIIIKKDSKVDFVVIGKVVDIKTKF